MAREPTFAECLLMGAARWVHRNHRIGTGHGSLGLLVLVECAHEFGLRATYEGALGMYRPEPVVFRVVRFPDHPGSRWPNVHPKKEPQA